MAVYKTNLPEEIFPEEPEVEVHYIFNAEETHSRDCPGYPPWVEIWKVIHIYTKEELIDHLPATYLKRLAEEILDYEFRQNAALKEDAALSRGGER